MSRPNIAILKTEGVNCDTEMSYAFESAGADSPIVHVNQLRSRECRLADFDGLGIAGGFSYGDDIASGAVFGNELTTYLGEELQEFVDHKKPILGVCNGFQILTRTGLLPNRTIGQPAASLTDNETDSFICEWVDLEAQDTVCQFVDPDDFDDRTVPMQIAHGEGRFVASDLALGKIIASRQIVFTYAENPNGSEYDIAGITDPSGVVLGMMPHPERSIVAFHPDRSRTQAARDAGQIIFENIVNYARNS